MHHNGGSFSRSFSPRNAAAVLPLLEARGCVAVEALFTGGYGLFVWNEEVRCFWFSRDSLAQEGGDERWIVL